MGEGGEEGQMRSPSEGGRCSAAAHWDSALRASPPFLMNAVTVANPSLRPTGHPHDGAPHRHRAGCRRELPGTAGTLNTPPTRIQAHTHTHTYTHTYDRVLSSRRAACWCARYLQHVTPLLWSLSNCRLTVAPERRTQPPPPHTSSPPRHLLTPPPASLPHPSRRHPHTAGQRLRRPLQGR